MFVMLGFLHSAFAFGHESLLLEEPVFLKEGHAIAAGTLLNLVHKGLKYMEIEAHLNEVQPLMALLNTRTEHLMML